MVIFSRYISILLILLLSVGSLSARSFSVRGRVVSESTRQGVPYVAVSVDGQPQIGAVTNLDGEFTIAGVAPGLFRLVGQSLGYDVGYSEDIMVSATTPQVEIFISPNAQQIDSIVVRPSLFRKMIESPVSLRRIGMAQIEKSPGANRDVSRIVQSYPGVAFSPAGYRNDLIVRGGSPSENKFFVDGIEIPNINHFSTQGASGGPVSILNADLIREIEFYTGAFPSQRAGALSSIMEVDLRDGDLDKQSFKATLGASEVSLSGSGHFSDRTTYLFSVRQSYLQMLFKMIGLPLLPNFIDGQIKIKHKLSNSDEISFLGLVGIDDMTLNEEGTVETTEYILSYLPTIEQETFTTGARYRHFSGEHSYSIVASHSYINNSNIKYQDNEYNAPSKLNLDLRSREQKSTLRSENLNTLSDYFTLRYGAQLDYTTYDVSSFTRYSDTENRYDSYLGYLSFGAHIGAGYRSFNDRFNASVGFRFDGNNFSSETTKFWEQLSPRVSLSYELPRNFSVSGLSGIYFTMPALTALSYKEGGSAINADLGYINVKQLSMGLKWQPQRELSTSIEGFYKYYTNMPISVANDIPLADLGTDYGTVGNEAYVQSGRGRAYGVELSGEWQSPGKIALVASLTLYRSEYATSSETDYRPSAWDSRVIFNASATRFLRSGWSVGAKVSAIGGAPFTPYDVEASALVAYWNTVGRPAYDYSKYNTQRYDGYAQLDLRVDKTFYFSKWMFGLYLDLQNAFVSEYEQQSIPISTGELSPDDSSRYTMKYLRNVSGTLLPTFGLTAQF